MIHIYNNIDSAKVQLFDLIQLEEIRQRPYFVDNDFFDNKYKMVGKFKYFCIKEREVAEWIKYTEEKEYFNQDSKKILYFGNYKR